LFLTFASPKDGSLPKKLVLTASGDDRENLMFHPEVNANVFRLFQRTNQDASIDERFIRNIQHPEGYFHAFYYPSRYYNTMIAAEILNGKEELNDVIRKTILFLESSQHPNGSWSGDCYETAMALNSLFVLKPRSDRIRKGIAYLVRHQDEDGFWRTGSVIWEFPLGIDKGKWKAYDESGLLTTGYVLMALQKARIMGIP